MSMDEMLMNELYGSEEIQQEEQIKQAQVELVEAVAAEAGVDLNELDDDELAKFAHYVLSDEDEDESVDSSADTTKLAALEEANLMGRQMAHSYIDELNNITQGDNTMHDDTFTKIASAMSDVAEAWDMEQMSDAAQSYGQEKTASISDLMAYELEKIAEDKPADGPSRFQKMREGASDYLGRAGRFAQHHAGYGAGMADKSTTEKVLRRGGSGLLAAGALYGGYRGAKALANRKKKQEKKASLFMDAGYEALAAIELCTPEEFAKEAEFRAAEILAANGVHPETFEDIEPEHIKVANFPGVEYAADEYEAEAIAEYNDMLDTAALHIIDNLID